MAELLRKESDPWAKTRIIEKVIEKVLIKENGIEIYFHVGKYHYTRELGLDPGSRPFLCPKTGPGKVLEFKKPKAALEKYRMKYSPKNGSTTLTQLCGYSRFSRFYGG